ncbi:MAG TPA: carbon-nitrogen hydrolase [Bacteroidota bacterium]|nr:carbon-nitrogen hydrolase [Bacteroidota bacterium]
MPEQLSFRVALVQMKVGGDAGKNLAAAAESIADAARKGADVVCLPELFASPYFCQVEDVRHFGLAEPLPGPTTDRLAAVARKEKIAVIVPVFERRGAGVYHNSLAVIDKTGDVVGIYRKMHIPDDPAYYEKFYFTPGDLGFRTFDLSVGRIGTMICWDQWFPEGARLTALQGASVLFYPTAIGWHPHEKEQFGTAQREAWKTVQRGHAVANGIYVAAVNRVGLEIPDHGGPGIEFWGSSFICDPQGVIIAEAPSDKEELLIGDIDLHHLEEVRKNWPFLRDRRIDAYQPITERYLDKDRGR